MADPYYPPSGQPIPPKVDDPIGAARPPGIFESKGDTAKFIIQLRRFKRPKVYIPNGLQFVWPIGTEGVVVSGTAKIGVHTFIGEGNADVQVIHRNEGRIEMSGMFMGETGAANVRILKNVLTADYPNTGLKLDLPGIFTYEHDVFVESYEFARAEEELSEDWTYRVVFVDSGHNKKKMPNLPTSGNPSNPATSRARGKSAKYLVVKDGMRTLRAISKKAFGNVNGWRVLYDANRPALDQIMREKNIAYALLPTTILPLGLKIYLSAELKTAFPSTSPRARAGVSGITASGGGGESL